MKRFAYYMILKSLDKTDILYEAYKKAKKESERQNILKYVQVEQSRLLLYQQLT